MAGNPKVYAQLVQMLAPYSRAIKADDAPAAAPHAPTPEEVLAATMAEGAAPAPRKTITRAPGKTAAPRPTRVRKAG